MSLIEIMKKKSVSLSFSLISGLAYFIIITKYIIENFKSNVLIAFFFFPAITFGIALVLVKSINTMTENDNKRGILYLVISQIVVIVLSILMLIEGYIV